MSLKRIRLRFTEGEAWGHRPTVHNQTVRRCFLLGNDSISGKNFDHRKQWMESELVDLAKFFGIDLLCYAILSNHFLDHEIFFSPSPPREEKGPGDEEVEARHEMAIAKRFLQASASRLYA